MPAAVASLSRAPAAASTKPQQRLPSAKFLLGAATHAFLLRQHGRCLALLSQLALGLAPPSTAWTEAELTPAREQAREAVRRQAAVLWLTSVACLVADDAATASSLPAGPSSPVAPAGSSYVGSLTGDSRTDDAIRSGSPASVLRALVGRCEALYALLSSSSPPGAGPRRLSSRSESSSSSTGDGGLGGVRAYIPLPPQVVQTLLLAGQKLGVSAQESASAILGPFQASIPLSLQHRLAGLSRARESEREFAPSRPITASSSDEGWLGDSLDGYEAVAQTWAVDVLCSPAADEKDAAEALRFVREDMVLGRARKTDLIDAIQRGRPTLTFLTNLSGPAAGGKTTSSRRPPSPGLSSSSSSSASSLNSVRTMTPPALTGSAESPGSPQPATKSSYARQVNAIHRFLAPRTPVANPTLHADDDEPAWSALEDDDESAGCSTPRPTSSTRSRHAGHSPTSTLTPHAISNNPGLRSLATVPHLLRILFRPTTFRLLIALILGLLGLWRRRQQKRQLAMTGPGAGGGGMPVGEAVRRRLGRGGWSIWGR